MAYQKYRYSTTIIHYITYLFVRLIAGILNCIPYYLMRKLATLAGLIFYYVHSPRRNIALDNLRQALGNELPECELIQIARKSFINLVLLGLEVIRIPRVIKNIPRYMTIERKEIVFDELKKGNGVIFLIAHYGNWEWGAVMAGYVNYPMSAVGRPMKNRFIYRYIERLRQSTGLKSLNKKGVAREIMQELRNNRVVAILFDQYAGSSGVLVPFFGRPAYTTSAVAQLAIRTGASVVPGYCTRNKDGTHTIYITDPIPTIKTNDRQADIIKNTCNYNANLESWIRKNPDQWFWVHKRWKTPRRYA